MATPLAAWFQQSGVSSALRNGPTHVLVVGDSISALTNNARLPGGMLREWGSHEMAPIVGVRCGSTDGPTDQWGKSFKGTTSQLGAYLKPGPGIEIEASGGAGTYTLGEVVTESGTDYTAIFLGESLGSVKLAYGPGDNNAIVGGGSTLTGATSGATRTLAAVVGDMTTDPLGMAMDIFPCAHGIQYASGNPNVSINIFRSILQNTASFKQGEWTVSLAITGRLIYLRHAGGFVGKRRTYRNSVSVASTNFSQATSADDTIAYTEESCGTGSGIPCEIRWEALSGDETGQFGKMCGAMFYRPSTIGLTLDSVAIGGDGIDKCLDTAICSDAHYEEYLTATNVHTNGTLVVVLYYGQNDAGLSQSTFETRLNSAITRFTTLGLAAGYAAVKFILVGHYNTGSAHLSEKNEACYNVASDNRTVAAYINLYDRWTEAYVTANTSDGIHPTLAFAQEIAAAIADEVLAPTQVALVSFRGRPGPRSRRVAYLGDRP